jgi:predicted MFS family arabinose efflux permease
VPARYRSVEGSPERPWTLYSARDRRIFLFVLCLIGVCNSLDRNIIGVLIEPIKVEFRVSDTLLGLLSGLSFAAFYATLGIPIARWADRGDRTKVISLSLLVWSVMTALCGLANTFSGLTIARFGVGAGEAGSIPAAQSLIADYYPPAGRARAIGIFTAAQSIGFAIGLGLGGVVAQAFGWRTAFIMVGVAGLALVPATYSVLKEPRRSAGASEHTHEAESTISALRVLLKKRTYRYILSAIVVYYVMAYGALAFVVSLMIRAHGESIARAGLIFGGITTVGSAVGAIIGGALADRFARRDIRWLARFPGWGLITALPLYEIALDSVTLWTMVPVLLLATTVLAAVVPAMFSALHVVCGSRRRALSVASAFFLVNLVGIGLGPMLSGLLSDHLSPIFGAAGGLRYALMIVTTALLPASYLMLCAARSLKVDAED